MVEDFFDILKVYFTIELIDYNLKKYFVCKTRKITTDKNNKNKLIIINKNLTFINIF